MLDQLDVAQTGRHAAVAVGVEAVEVHGHVAVVAGAALHGIQNRIDLAVNDLGGVLAGGVDEHGVGIRLVIGAVDVAVAERELQVGRDLASPLLALTGFLGGLDSLLDLGESLLIALRDDAGDGVLLLAAVDALGFPDVGERDTARDDYLGRGRGFVNF